MLVSVSPAHKLMLNFITPCKLTQKYFYYLLLKMKTDGGESDFFPFRATRGPACTQHPQIDSSVGLVLLYISVMTQRTL